MKQTITNGTWEAQQHTLKKALGLVLAATIMGCVAEDEGVDTTPSEPSSHEESLTSVSQDIQNGTRDTGRKSIVGMYTFQGQFGGICSGTLIAPNLVLTAQHCIAELPGQYIDCSRSRFGATNSPRNIYITTDTSISQNGNFYGVREVLVPQDSNFVCGNDIALLILSQNVSSSVTTPIIPRLDEPVRRFEQYTAVGYGHIGNNSGSGTRRFIDNRVIQCGGNSSCPSWAATPKEMVSYDSNTCQGDSGGAALDSQGRLLATLSRGGPDPNNPNNTCYSSVHVTVASWSEWIRNHALRAAQLGQYQPPSWVGNSTLLDNDFDGHDDDVDNCPEVSNADQKDFDNDGFGDACDDDIDGDGLNNNQDNCATIANADQKDFDNDRYGDLCDNDDDNDGILDAQDNCPLVQNGRQRDFDNDGIGDLCDDDDDGDGVLDDVDECPQKVNPCQVVMVEEPMTGGTGGTDTDMGSNPGTSGGDSDPDKTPTSEERGEEEPVIIIFPEDDDGSSNSAGGTCSASSAGSPAQSPLTLLLGVAGLIGIGRRRKKK